MPVKKHVSHGGSRKAKPLSRRGGTDADVPELGDDWFEQADEYLGTKLVRRGRPPGSARKTQTTLRVSNDVLAWFPRSRVRAGRRAWTRCSRSTWPLAVDDGGVPKQKGTLLFSFFCHAEKGK